MHWIKEPEVKRSREGNVERLSVTGDLIRDLPSETREHIGRRMAVSGVERLLIDLKEIGRFGSWGEHQIQRLTASVTEIDGRVGVVLDASRRAQFRGLELCLEDEARVRFFLDEQKAIGWLEGP